MTVYNSIIVALWFLFVAYWALMAMGAKKTLSPRFSLGGIGLRLSVIALVLLALRVPIFHGAFRGARAYTAGASALMGLTGIALCALGIGLAVWARVHLGRNWGMPMSRKENPELVTGGPYAYVRHPIYTGVLLAMLGSAIGESALWLMPLVLCGIYMLYSARREEKLMIEQFPEQYPAYMRRTKMLAPFIL